MIQYMKEPTTYRPTPEVQRKIEELIKKYDNYKTATDVIRAGVFCLERWRREQSEYKAISRVLQKK